MAILRYRWLVRAVALLVLMAFAGCAGLTTADTVESLLRQAKELYAAARG